MTFEELTKANATIKHTDIGKGKEYAEVNQRIKAFRMLMPNGSIETEMLSWVDGIVVFKATVKNEDGKIIGTGTAYEKEGSSFINKTSAVENCETSSVGRALAMCGIGIDLSIASYEEVANAKLNQEEKQAQKMLDATREDMIKVVNAHYPGGSDALKMLLGCWGIDKVEDAKDEQLRAVFNKYKGK